MTVSIVSTTKTAEILTNNGVYGPLLTLTTAGTISVAGTALANQNGSPTIVNYGLIQGTGGGGVGFNVTNQPGYLTNSGRLLGGAVGVDFGNGGSIINSGTITGSGGTGVEILGRAGSVQNTGVITGTTDGIYLQNAATLFNTGSISGALGVYLKDGGTLTNTGGTIKGTAGLGIKSIGPAATISNSGTVSGTTGAVYMQNDGTVSNTGLLSGTNFGISISTGGTIIDAGTISGGTYAIKTTNQATLVVDPGAAFSGTVKNTTNQGNVILGGTTPGTLNIGSSFTGFNNLTFAAGSTWTLEGSVSALASGQTITGFAAGDAIVLNGFTPISETFVTGTGLVLNNGTTTQTIALAGSFSSSSFNFTTINGVVAVYEVCFAEGTRIATPDGEVEVERLVVGDLVTTLHGAKPVTWLGYRSVDVSKLKDPETGRLVRVRAHAFGENKPHRDLLVTQEHCLYVEGLPGAGLPSGDLSGGGLIPARMLVNGRSIIIDRTIGAYTYYHVELEEHGILLAEGMPAESYLDTGNRANFANSEAPALRPDFDLKAGHKRWEADAAAPLTVDRAIVEPIWRALEQRAVEQGLVNTSPAPQLTNDPDLRLVAASGAEIRPVRIKGNSYVFMLPDAAGPYRLRSRASRPADVIGPFVDDRNERGVLVGKVMAWHGRHCTALTAHRTTETLEGWYEPLWWGVRWTNGDAVLPLDLSGAKITGAKASASRKPVPLEIEVTEAGPYLMKPEASEQQNAAGLRG